MSDSFDPMDCSSPSSSVHGDSQGKNTGVDCQALLYRVFPTQGSDPGLQQCRQIPYHLSHQGSPGVLTVKNLPADAGGAGDMGALGQEDPPE